MPFGMVVGLTSCAQIHPVVRGEAIRTQPSPNNPSVGWLPILTKAGDTAEVKVSASSILILTAKSGKQTKMMAQSVRLEGDTLVGDRSPRDGELVSTPIDSIAEISVSTVALSEVRRFSKNGSYILRKGERSSYWPIQFKLVDISTIDTTNLDHKALAHTQGYIDELLRINERNPYFTALADSIRRYGCTNFITFDSDTLKFYAQDTLLARNLMNFFRQETQNLPVGDFFRYPQE